MILTCTVGEFIDCCSQGREDDEIYKCKRIKKRLTTENKRIKHDFTYQEMRLEMKFKEIV